MPQSIVGAKKEAASAAYDADPPSAHWTESKGVLMLS